MIEGNIKDLEIKWLQETDWLKMRDFLILKFQEAKTEEEFNFILKALVGSMFRGVDELEKARKALQLKHISDHEKKKMKKIFDESKNEK